MLKMTVSMQQNCNFDHVCLALYLLTESKKSFIDSLRLLSEINVISSLFYILTGRLVLILLA